MNRRRNLLISGIAICCAGWFAEFSWMSYAHLASVMLMSLAVVLLIWGLVLFVLNFKS